MSFTDESQFEESLICRLSQCGWESEVLRFPTEKDLLNNWASILFANNRGIDRLNDCPLTDGEMGQIIEQIKELRSPLKLNGFINGKSVSIKRDNLDDALHYGKEVSLKIYDRAEIAAGQSRYQIVQQPQFTRKSELERDRRGDLMLLINGMPVFHIELKRSRIPLSRACFQIEQYAHEGHFSGIFSLVQIFIAMTPEDACYFANPGPEGRFFPEYRFRWADVNNELILHWDRFAKELLSIPMAHQLIGFYTVADASDGVLKVMRSYQYYAASKISDTVEMHDWSSCTQRGGFIWHTTGSGKTMTSFKSAQLIAQSGRADKVLFLTDRIELATQSLKEYRGFAEASESIQATEHTGILLTKLKSLATADSLILTSIQKLNNISKGDEVAQPYEHDLAIIRSKRLVFIIDEAHRSTFGDMMNHIKDCFPRALFFGFTGTPVHEENQKKQSTTVSIFGNELHRYSIADGIRDKNVLGFDPIMVTTYRDRDLRHAVALEKAKTSSLDEVLADEKKANIYYRYMDKPMASIIDESGDKVKGIEDYLLRAQYDCERHRMAVLQDVKENWQRLSHNGKFHAIFAASRIGEAIEYYRLFKQEMPNLATSCLVDPSEDHNEGAIFKHDALLEVVSDYNERFGMKFTLDSYTAMKKDIALRLAHKEYHRGVAQQPEAQLHLLIVVDQMLTGFDSKWVNTLYLDKMLEYEHLIQAFSRTNRLFGPDKPFGSIRYYRRPHTMSQRIDAAVKLYSGDKPLGLFVPKIHEHLRQLNEIFEQINDLFNMEKIYHFNKLPQDPSSCAKFAKLFNQLNNVLEAAKIQGFSWTQKHYELPINEEGKHETPLEVLIDRPVYDTLLKRYKELIEPREGSEQASSETLAYDIDTYLIERDTARIDAEYMDARFNKYLKILTLGEESQQAIDDALEELLKSFSSLSQEEQRYANIFLHDIQRGDVIAEPQKTMRDYINEYMARAQSDEIYNLAQALGIEEKLLRDLLQLGFSHETDVYASSIFDELAQSIDKVKARAYLESKLQCTLKPFEVNRKVRTLLAQFIIKS